MESNILKLLENALSFLIDEKHHEIELDEA